MDGGEYEGELAEIPAVDELVVGIESLSRISLFRRTTRTSHLLPQDLSQEFHHTAHHVFKLGTIEAHMRS